MVWALGMAACRSSQAVRPRGRRRCRGPGPSLRVLKAGCVSVVPYKVCAGHIIVDRDAGVTQGVRTSQPAVFRQVVFMRERKEQACSVGISAYFAGVLDPVIHARDMLPPESIVTGGSLAKGSKTVCLVTVAVADAEARARAGSRPTQRVGVSRKQSQRNWIGPYS